MYLGTESKEDVFRMNNHVNGNEGTLLKTDGEKDLGVWFDKNPKPSIHVPQLAAMKVKQPLGLIRTFTYMDCSLIRQLFTSLVRPPWRYPNVVCGIRVQRNT
jgi:hypothetical protein